MGRLGDRTVDEMGHAWVNVTYISDEDYADWPPPTSRRETAWAPLSNNSKDRRQKRLLTPACSRASFLACQTNSPGLAGVNARSWTSCTSAARRRPPMSGKGCTDAPSYSAVRAMLRVLEEKGHIDAFDGRREVCVLANGAPR